MKVIIMVCAVFIVVFVAFVIAVNTSTGTDTRETKQVQQVPVAATERNQDTADTVVNNSLHIKDPRTGLCYLYYWGGGYNGGPALAGPISCEAVPSTLLITGRAKVK